MAVDQLEVWFDLDKIKCLDAGDESATAEPFLWIVYFKIDGDTVFVGEDLMLKGSATVASTPDGHRNLPGDVAAGGTLSIPPSLGRFKTTLRPIPTAFASKAVGSICGFIAILLEEDSTSDHDIDVGRAALNKAVQTGLDDLIKTMGVLKRDVTDDEIKAFEDTLSAKVENAIANDASFFQGTWSCIGFGNGQDAKLGTATFIGKYSRLAEKVGTTQDFDWSFNPGAGEGRWRMFASVAVHKIVAAAIMRSGNWNSGVVLSGTTQRFVAKNQSLFDNQELRLLQMDTWLDNGTRRWLSIHRAGDWAHALRVDLSQAQFLGETQDLFDDKGLRLENMVTYEDNGVRRWAGSYRSGDWAHRLILDRDATTFAKDTQEFFDHEGLRLEQLVTYLDKGVRRWGGIYRSGNWAHRFTMDRDTATFIDETQKWLDHDGLRLIDVERYEVNGQVRWAGVYRSGVWGHRLVIDRGIKSLVAQTQDSSDKHKLRLVNVKVYQL